MTISSEYVYALIGSFERDMRNLLEHYVISQLGEEEALGPHFAGADLRRREEGADDLSAVEFLDLRHEYELLNTHRELLPSGLAREVRELTRQLDVITPWRRKTAHYRSYGRPGGQPAAVEELITAFRSFQNSLWRELHKTLSTAASDDAFMLPPQSLLDSSPQRVQHNLPSADYDETGLVGREDAIEGLLADLKRGRERVITLLGEGGIGKSALALETAYRLLDDEEAPFELVLWVSLKTERLTAYGIESISNAIDSITGAAQYLGNQLSEDPFTGSIEDLAVALGETPALIIFDNLETTTGEEFLRLYEVLPDSVQFLVTSRNGIGQVERRRPVGPLSDRDGVLLFNWLVKNRRVDALSQLSNRARQQVVRELRNSPLALKWYVMSVEAGQNPVSKIRNQAELLAFCVRNVFDQLSEEAQVIAVALHILNRPVYQEDLAILVGLSAQDTQSAIQDLVRHSLVIWTFSAETSMSMTLNLTDTANAFLQDQVDPDHPLRQRVAVRERDFREFNERTQIEARKHFFSPNVIRHRTDADRPAAMLLFRALNDFRNGQVTKAESRIEEARSLAPDFWEVARAEAFIYSSGNPELASLKYLDAYRLAESDESRAIVAHHFGGHLARSEKDLEGALNYLQEAHDYFKASDTARALGSNLVWLGRFDEGIQLLWETLDTAEGKGRVIATSLLIDALRRRAEYHLNVSHSAAQAWNDCWQSWTLGKAELDGGTTDQRILQHIWKNISQALQVLRIALDTGLEPEETGNLLADLADYAVPLVSNQSAADKYGIYVSQRLEQLSEFPALQKSVRKALDRLSAAGLKHDEHSGPSRAGPVHSEKPSQQTVADSLEEGVITMLDPERGYGFIRTESFPNGVFFHLSMLRGGLSFADLQIGQRLLAEAEEVAPKYGSSPRATRVLPWSDGTQ